MNEYVVWLRQQGAGKGAVGVPAPASVPEFLVKVIGEKYALDLQAVPYRGSAPMIADMLGKRPHDTLSEISRQSGVPMDHLLDAVRRQGYNTGFVPPPPAGHMFMERAADGRWAGMPEEAAATRQRLYDIRREQIEKYGQPETLPGRTKAD